MNWGPDEAAGAAVLAVWGCGLAIGVVLVALLVAWSHS